MKETYKTIVEAIEEKKGEGISVIDLSEVEGTICDAFIVCEAQSTSQTDAIYNEVEKQMIEKHHEKPLRIQGRENGVWIILDYGDVFVHIFEKQTREFYGLDELWSDAPTTKIQTQY